MRFCFLQIDGGASLGINPSGELNMLNCSRKRKEGIVTFGVRV